MKRKPTAKKLAKIFGVKVKVRRPYDYWSVHWRILGTEHGITTGKDGAATHAASVILAGADVVMVAKCKCDVSKLA